MQLQSVVQTPPLSPEAGKMGAVGKGKG